MGAAPMKFHTADIQDVHLIELQPFTDERGWFARTFCKNEFTAAGITEDFVQTNHSQCVSRGTLRGLHYQIPPHAEGKLIRCTQGAIFDVVVDLRAGSPTFGCWQGFELTATNQNMVFCPAGCAHGYQALTDGAEVIYQASAFYAPECEQQVRFDDPRFGIKWPVADPILSPKDAATPSLPSDFQGVIL